MRYQSSLSIFRKVQLATVGLTTALLVAGCAGGGVNGPGPVPGMPLWFKGQVEVADGVVQGFGTGRSTNMRVARSIARVDATTEIARFQTQRAEGRARLLDDLAGTEYADVITVFEEASKLIFAEELVGVRQANSVILEDGDTYIVYVLLEQDPKAVAAAYEARMQEQQAAYARFRMTEVFEQMEEDIRRYEERRPGNRR